ncbi:MAG: ribosome maturation factor RimM [Eubacterium sp.]|jgi:16S rRNA processing protein RimM|nr:ribosome maturation factor RimM [Eubacterium sp.]
MKKYLEIAKITKTQGLNGELRAQYYCDDPEEISCFKKLYLKNGKDFLSPKYIRPHKNVVIIKFGGVDTLEEAVKYIGETLYIDRGDVDLPANTWFIQDLIGLRVVDADSGLEYGRVKEILQNAPTDVYMLNSVDGRELLFPAIPEVLLDVSLEKGEIFIRPLKGLFGDED